MCIPNIDGGNDLNQKRVDQKRVAVSIDMRVGPMSERRVNSTTKELGQRKPIYCQDPF